MRHVLVTGGGPVAQAATRALLARGAVVTLWLHARDRGELDVRASRCPLRTLPGVTIAGGDLLDERPFERLDPRAFTDIVHAAAITRFTVTCAHAQAVNVQGAAHVVAFARACAALRSLTHVSSVHAAGLAEGWIAEEPLPPGPRAFANEYERSKAGAEAVVTAARDVPWVLARPSTILARDAGGERVQASAVHVVLRLLRAGLLPVVPGLATCPVHLTTARHVGEGLARLIDAPAATTWHLTAPPARAPSLGELLALARDRMLASPLLAKRGVPAPLIVDVETFEILVRGSRGLASGVLTSALDCVAPFARQLAAPKTIATARTESFLGESGDDPRAVLAAVVDRMAEPTPAASPVPQEMAS